MKTGPFGKRSTGETAVTATTELNACGDSNRAKKSRKRTRSGASLFANELSFPLVQLAFLVKSFVSRDELDPEVQENCRPRSPKNEKDSGSALQSTERVNSFAKRPTSMLGEEMEDSQQIRCDQLTKIYGKSKSKALDSVSFSIPTEGVFVLIGRNGSGKTTLVRILATELTPTSGKAFINGIDVVKEPRRLRERIAVVPQEARAVPWMTPMQTVLSYLLWRGFSYAEAKQRASDSLGRLGLSGYANSLNRTLSGGLRRKVLVAMILS
jgi:ABC-type glutathione transport system ATPase component